MTKKVAVITGGAQGIGFAAALRLAKDGFALGLWDSFTVFVFRRWGFALLHVWAKAAIEHVDWVTSFRMLTNRCVWLDFLTIDHARAMALWEG